MQLALKISFCDSRSRSQRPWVSSPIFDQIHRFQPGGGVGHEGSGFQPGAGVHPGGGGGQFGGGLKRGVRGEGAEPSRPSAWLPSRRDGASVGACSWPRFAAFIADRGTRKPSAHTIKAYCQDFGAIATCRGCRWATSRPTRCARRSRSGKLSA
jgi:hypothetical protein